MAKFCECGSLMKDDSCTNRKCKNHIGNHRICTFYQMEYIKGLQRELGDETEYDFTTMTVREASQVIDKLEDIREERW